MAPKYKTEATRAKLVTKINYDGLRAQCQGRKKDGTTCCYWPRHKIGYKFFCNIHAGVFKKETK